MLILEVNNASYALPCIVLLWLQLVDW